MSDGAKWEKAIRGEIERQHLHEVEYQTHAQVKITQLQTKLQSAEKLVDEMSLKLARFVAMMNHPKECSCNICAVIQSAKQWKEQK
jgi:hypothetical protein